MIALLDRKVMGHWKDNKIVRKSYGMVWKGNGKGYVIIMWKIILEGVER